MSTDSMNRWTVCQLLLFGLAFYGFPAEQKQRDNQHQREYASGQHTGLQTVTCLLRNCAHQARPERTAQIASHGKKSEQCGTALGKTGRGDADCAGPHDCHGESAKNAADQAQNRAGRQGCQQIAA